MAVSDGRMVLSMSPDSICTITTSSAGLHGQAPAPPVSAPFPSPFETDFSEVREDALAPYFSDVYGSFSVRGGALTQLGTGKPTGWAPVNYDPLTLIGPATMGDFEASATALVNHTAPHHYLRLCGGCSGRNRHGIYFGCEPGCCLNVSWTGQWAVGKTTGTIAGFKDEWHALGLNISNGTVTASVDGRNVATVSASCPAQGMAGIGCGKYHACQVRKYTLIAQ